MNTLNYKAGVGLEHEGFFLDSEGKAIETIDGKPTSEFVLDTIMKEKPELITKGLVSPELVSVTFEVKTDIHSKFEEAVPQCFELQKVVNDILAPHDGQFVFTPVLTKPYKIVPSVLAARSPEDKYVAIPENVRKRIYRVLEFFGNNERSEEMLYDSTIASLQLNDSRFFSQIRREGNLEKALFATYNTFQDHIHQLLAFNSDEKDFRGKTRMQAYVELQQYVKQEQFEKRGLMKENIVFPKKFLTEEGMKEYICAQRGTNTYEEAIKKPKDDHGFIKYKHDVKALETRFIDAITTEADVLKVCKAYEKIMLEVQRQARYNMDVTYPTRCFAPEPLYF